jgi:dsRNA-specific ribonuclease
MTKLFCKRLIRFSISDYLYGHFPRLKKSQLEKIMMEFSKSHRIEAASKDFYQDIFDLYHKEGMEKCRELVIQKLIQKNPIDVTVFLKSQDPIEEVEKMLESRIIKSNKVKLVKLTLEHDNLSKIVKWQLESFCEFRIIWRSGNEKFET